MSKATTTEQQIELSMVMFTNAIDAESRRDYRAAVYYYEQIEKLPKEDWPGGLEIRLEAARKQAAAAGR